MIGKQALQAFKTEFGDIVEAIAEKLQQPPDEVPQGVVVEYEIQHLEALVRLLKLRLPTIPRIVRRHVRIPEGDLLLWHGTSEDRAQSILKWGFRAGRRKRGIFFSTNIMTSYSYSEGKDARDRSGPAVLAARYDLSTLKHEKDFRLQDHMTETHCIFRATIATQIVRYLLTRRGLYSTGKLVMEANRFRDDLTEITVTQSSGAAGIAYWLNSFLDLRDSERISETHPAVGRIKAWVDEQYANDRTIPIADEEILILARSYLPEYFEEGLEHPAVNH